MNEISNISVSWMLSVEDIDFLVKNISSFTDTMEKKQIWRTNTEINFSVLNDLSFPTPDSKYWQCIREQDVFLNNLIVLSFEYEKNIIEIKKIQRNIENEKDELEIALYKIELKEKLYKQKNMELASKDRMREIKIWEHKKLELAKECKFSLQNNDEHQLHSYSMILNNKIKTINQFTPPADANNIIWQKITLDRIIKNENNLLH